MNNREEFRCSMELVENAFIDMRKQLERIGNAVSNEKPFKIMTELSEMNDLIREAMEHTLKAQQHKINDHVIEMQRIA